MKIVLSWGYLADEALEDWCPDCIEDIGLAKDWAIEDFQNLYNVTKAFNEVILHPDEKNSMVIRKNTISHFLTKILPVTDMSTCNL